eukprot:TRINITY_DN1544_c0_g1_i6.p1 TRINITY_DN1544_c0_g1~~TRINITY_DN1544_c0_g1_i6.p1  ORF type:complete len:839 (+),score=111.49 TRINITY_DN1544_c0_g1_i6:258-2774(+)
MLRNAHLIGLFNRICKLIFWQIRPVFVFDGGTPTLKQHTTEVRRQRRHKSEIHLRRVAERLVQNQLKTKALEAMSASIDTTDRTDSGNETRRLDSHDMFQLPDEGHVEPVDFSSDEDVNQLEVYTALDLPLMDIDRGVLAALPADIQDEIISHLRDSRDTQLVERRTHLRETAPTPEQFSLMQLQTLKTSALERSQQREDGNLNVVTRRISSQANREYLLIRDDTVASAVAADRNILKEQMPSVAIQRSRVWHYSHDAATSLERPNVWPEGPLGERDGDSSVNAIAISSDQPEVASRSQQPDAVVVSDSDDDLHLSERVATERETVHDKRECGHGSSSPLSRAKSATQLTANLTTGLGPLLPSAAPTFDTAPTSCVPDSAIFLPSRLSASRKVIASLQDTRPQTVHTNTTQQTGAYDVADGDLFLARSTVVSRCASPHKHLCVTPVRTEITPVSPREDRRMDSPTKADRPEADLPQITVDEIAIVREMLYKASDTSAGAGTKQSGLHNATSFPLFSDMVQHSLDQEELSELRAQLVSERAQLQDEQRRAERQIQTVSDDMIAEAQELLRLFGLPYVTGPMEAEAQCAALELAGIVDGIISDDSDTFLFGGQKVYKNIFNQQQFVECYNIRDAESQLGLNRERMIQLALLLGSDYTGGVDGVGAVSAMEILHEFSSLEAFRSWFDQEQADPATDELSKARRKKFSALLKRVQLEASFPSTRVVDAYLHPIVQNVNIGNVSWARPDLDKLRLYASEKFGWTRERIDKALLPVIRKLQSDIQPRINEFFPHHLQPVPPRLQSTRLKRAVSALTGQELPPARKGRTARSASDNKQRQRASAL